MAIPDNRPDLESMGYKYDGSSRCRGCGAMMDWYITPKEKKMPMSEIPGTEEDTLRKIQPHWAVCPKRDQFRSNK